MYSKHVAVISKLSKTSVDCKQIGTFGCDKPEGQRIVEHELKVAPHEKMRIIKPLRIQSPSQMVIGVYDHLLRKVSRFRYHSQKGIGSLGNQSSKVIHKDLLGPGCFAEHLQGYSSFSGNQFLVVDHTNH